MNTNFEKVDPLEVDNAWKQELDQDTEIADLEDNLDYYRDKINDTLSHNMTQ